MVDPHRVSWVTDYLTDGPQWLRLGAALSDVVVSDVGAPQWMGVSVGQGGSVWSTAEGLFKGVWERPPVAESGPGQGDGDLLQEEEDGHTAPKRLCTRRDEQTLLPEEAGILRCVQQDVSRLLLLVHSSMA